jgi:hypothetical protein
MGMFRPAKDQGQEASLIRSQDYQIDRHTRAVELAWVVGLKENLFVAGGR